MLRNLLPALLATAALAQPGDLIANGDFLADAAGWSTYFAPGQAKGTATWQPRGQGDGFLRVTVESTIRESAVQVWRGPFAIAKGQRYLVTFEARAPEPLLLPLRLMKDGPNYNAYGLSTTVPVSAAWQTFELTAVATADAADARLDFFGVGSFDLDSVAVRPAPPAALHPPSKATLGPGWSGNPQHLLDDNPQSEVNSGSYFPVPLFVMVDLEEGEALRQVVAGSRDGGDYVQTNSLAVEVADAQGGWRRWATASKRATDSNRTEFTASSLAVRTHRFRLRIDSVKNLSWLSGIRVETGPHGAAAEQLPFVPPGEDLAFVGWDYDRLGYDWSPGEALALRWQNNGDRLARVPLNWRLEAYHGDPLEAGDGMLNIAPGEVGSLPVTVPASAPDGGATVRVTFDPAQGGAQTPFYVDLRRAPDEPLKLRVVALFDSQDPEGWVRLMAGPLAPYLEVFADFPAAPVDAVLVQAARWPDGDDRLTKLEAAVRGGTPALVFGAPLPDIAGWLPATAAGWAAERGVLQGAWLPARRHRLALSPRAGAEVLQRWSDGTPAVVRGKVGQGTVVQFGLASGQTWLRSGKLAATDALAMQTLYDVCGKSAPLASWTAPDAGTPNVGRFGWKLTEGGLVENLQEDGTATCPADPSRPWHPLHESFDRAPRIADQNWLSKTLVWTREGREALRATLSMASPYLLWETPEPVVELPLTATSVVYRPGGSRVEGDAPGAGWLLVLDTDAARPDVPRLVICQRLPQRVAVGETLKLTFDGPAGAVWTGRPLGLNRAATLDAALAASRAAAETAFRFPVDCLETATLDGERVTIRDQFVYRPLQPDWPVEPRAAAAVPPVMALAKLAGAPLELGGAAPTGCATKYGPLHQLPGESIAYTINLPRHEPFAPIPTAGDEPLREQMAYYGLQGALSVTRASGGMSLNGPFTADLLSYVGSGRFENPFESPCIDLYKWWYCFPTVQGRPGYGDEARAKLDAHWQTQYAETLNRYGYKCYVRQRREPYSKTPYTVTFIWPTMVQDGVRYFVDQNESSAVIMSCLDAYARFHGDWDTVAANWNFVRNLYDYLPKFHDWAWMASSNQEFFSVAGIDMLNSEYPGNLAYAEMAAQLGYGDEATRATILAAKALVPAVARLAMPAYVKSITGDSDPWRADRFYFSFDEFGLCGMPNIVMRGGPHSILDLAIGMLDTSKGTTPEMALAYRDWSRELMDGYQRALVEAEAEFKQPVGWMHQMQRAVLGWPKDEVRATANAFRQFKPNFGWQAAKAPSNLAVVQSSGGDMFLSEWLPAAYVSGRYEPAANRVILTLTNDQPGPVRLKLCSKRRVTGLTANGQAVPFAYDAASGWLAAEIAGQGAIQVAVAVAERVAVTHPYLGD